MYMYVSVCVLVNHYIRVAIYHPPQISLTFPWFFPDILQFSMSSDRSKKILFFSLMVLTVSLQIWVLLLKERICSQREQILSFKNSPQWGGRWAYTISWERTSFSLLNRINFLRSACHIHLFSNSLTFPWLSKAFLNFPDHPQNSLTWKKFHFPDIFPWPWQPCYMVDYFLVYHTYFDPLYLTVRYN